ncbi:MAG: isocitrate lyase/PEP mutase family protein [Pseudomonadota bacterium]|nr:isocitrate lyase/PEP mutase family protein [Pseudomonadota bacterium]
MSGGSKLRKLMGDGMVVAPGAYDGLTARLISQADFAAVYMTGGGTSSGFGYPDYGLLTMSEMVENAGRIVDAVELPVISDADNGYGNELNTYRTIRAFEKAGVAGVHIEDQAFPKKCGHLDDKELVPLEDYVAKIRAAADARRSDDFVIIARTDARASLGFEEGVRRCNAALEAGADVAFLEAMQTVDELKAAPKEIHGLCLLNVVRGGKTPEVSFAEAEEMGYKIAIVPGLLLIQAIGACDQALADMKAEGRHPKPLADLSPADAFARVGAAEWDPRREQYREPAVKDAAE